MSAIEDFKNAPVGAIANRRLGSHIKKTGDDTWHWLLPTGISLNDEEMANQGFTLVPPAPTTSREALELTWELAHEVKPGQVIPEGTHYLEVTGSGLKEYTATCNFPTDPHAGSALRTLEPLPEPEPDWLDAPAVLARLDEWDRNEPEVFIPAGEQENNWVAMFSAQSYHWSELIDVTPLYPKETET